MTDLVAVVLLLVAAAGARWLLGDLRTVPRGGPPDGPHRDPHRGGRVSVVVPARDEATTLPPLLDSLRGLHLADVVVVDDESRDGTAAVARAGGAVVLPAADRPPGWTGKAWACHVGARATSGDLLLFLDADTVLGPDALDGLLALHDEHGGLVSVQPFHDVVRPYEQLSSYFNVVSLLASGAFARRPARRPMAFGPVLLTTRADYLRAGGHAAVRGEILDDVQLAAAYHRAGLPVRCAVGGRSVRMRSYPGGLRQLADGWTKNIASGASATSPGPLLATVLWVCAQHAVAVGAALALVVGVTGWGASLTYADPAVWAVGWVGVAWQLRSVLRRIGSFRWWTWVLFPVCLLAFDVLFARSAALTLVRRSVRWRGREVGLGSGGPAGEGRLMLRLLLPQTTTIVLDVLAWGVFHAATGYAAYRLGDDRLEREGRLLRARRFETGGRWHRRWLRVHRWKDRVPEAGALFRGGMSKRHLPARDVAGLRLFVRETRRAELAHWWAMLSGLLFVVWNPPLAASLLIGYGVAANLPFIVIQRYNRFRIQTMLQRRSWSGR